RRRPLAVPRPWPCREGFERLCLSADAVGRRSLTSDKLDAPLMNDISFETALSGRVDRMLDACTRCGKCVEVCPSVKPAGIAETKSEDIIGGVLDIVRSGQAPG